MTAERNPQNSTQHNCAETDCKQTKYNLDPLEDFHVFPPACVFSSAATCITPFLFRSFLSRAVIVETGVSKPAA
jgi:hypothetical protein